MRNSHEGGKGSPRDKEEPEAGCDNYTKENQQKRRETAPGQPRDCQGELAAWKRTGGVSKVKSHWRRRMRKTGTKTIENRERHKGLRVGEKGRKEQAETLHAEKRRPKGKEKMEPQQEPTPQTKRNPEMPRKAGGASIP